MTMNIVKLHVTAALFAISTDVGPVYALDVVSGHAQVTQAQTSPEGVEWVIQGLRQAGYRIISVRSTFLGRIRILAENRTYRRELIISRSTGVIFRDRVEYLSAGKDTTQHTRDAPGKMGSDAPDSSQLDIDLGFGGVGLNVDGGSSESNDDQKGGSGSVRDTIGGISGSLGGN